MAPVNTMTPSVDTSDNRERAFEAKLNDLSGNSHLEVSEYSGENEAPRRVVTSETALGADVTVRDFFSSDRTYEEATSAARQQVESSYETPQQSVEREAVNHLKDLITISERIGVMRDEKAA